MFALALRIWRYVLTLEIGCVEDESTKDEETSVPARQYYLGFASDEEEAESDE